MLPEHSHSFGSPISTISGDDQEINCRNSILVSLAYIPWMDVHVFVYLQKYACIHTHIYIYIFVSVYIYCLWMPHSLHSLQAWSAAVKMNITYMQGQKSDDTNSLF